LFKGTPRAVLDKMIRRGSSRLGCVVPVRSFW
jgi:hypothetical protein